jgi:hypothetical protein
MPSQTIGQVRYHSGECSAIGSNARRPRQNSLVTVDERVLKRSLKESKIKSNL